MQGKFCQRPDCWESTYLWNYVYLPNVLQNLRNWQEILMSRSFYGVGSKPLQVGKVSHSLLEHPEQSFWLASSCDIAVILTTLAANHQRNKQRGCHTSFLVAATNLFHTLRLGQKGKAATMREVLFASILETACV